MAYPLQRIHSSDWETFPRHPLYSTRHCLFHLSLSVFASPEAAIGKSLAPAITSRKHSVEETSGLSVSVRLIKAIKVWSSLVEFGGFRDKASALEFCFPARPMVDDLLPT